MNKKLIFLFLVILTSCTIDLMKFHTEQEAIDFVVKKIKYKNDSSEYGIPEYWQSPRETFLKKTGDCEDKAILLMYYLGAKTELVIVKTSSKTAHAYVKHKNYYICPTSGIKYKKLSNVLAIYDYQTTMFLCGHGVK